MPPSGPRCVGSSTFDPDAYFNAWSSAGIVYNDLESFIKQSFGLDNAKDTYVYHAGASVTLDQVQRAIGHGGQRGLHAWYRDEEGQQTPPPPQPDITAYTAIFSPQNSSSKALTAFTSNAKKSSIRSAVAANLLATRTLPSSITIPKSRAHINPYLDVWTWSCHNLEWCGPDVGTAQTKQSHHVLPVFFHHYGCVCPSSEALEIVKSIAKGRGILDIGSGNGYWTYMLRRAGLTATPIDNGDSLWRVMWVGDTVKADGERWLARNRGGEDKVLLLVYPQVTGDFTTAVIENYKGDTIVVAGTQNQNGFTAFGDMTIDLFVERKMPGWEKVVQVPLPSFAGKDEALFVFEKKKK